MAKASKRCGKQNWATPHQLFDALHKEFQFQTDVCAEAENTKLPAYYDITKDGLAQDWSGVCWMNPPYGETGKWMKKAYESAQAGATVVCLVPVDTSTKWWWEYCSRAAEIRFIVGRLKFIDTGAVVKRTAPANFASAIIVFRQNCSEGKVSYIDTHWIIIFGVTIVALRFRRPS